MNYRYGDATPFPFDDNFIETIGAATDACVALFRCDVAGEARRLKAQDVRRRADDDMKRLDVLLRAVEASLGPMLPEGKSERAFESAANRIAAAARGTVKNARVNVEKQRDSGVRLAFAAPLGDRVRRAVANFLVDHQLPKTKWTIRWMYDHERGRTTAVVIADTPCGLHAEFEAELSVTHPWTAPVRVGELCPEMKIKIQRDAGWIRKRTRMETEQIHRYYITEAEVSPGRESFVIRRHYKKPSAGYIVVIRDGEKTQEPTITRVLSDGSTPDLPLTLSGDSADALERLWSYIDDDLAEMRNFRCDLLSAEFDGTPVERLDEPSEVAEAILGSLAPIIREMRLRSRVPGELVLKRDTGDGRREEVFVPRQALEAKFADLPERHRRLFEAIGLSSEATCDFVGREFPLAAPPKTPPPSPIQKRQRRRAARSPVPPPPPLPKLGKIPAPPGMKKMPPPPPIPRKLQSPVLRSLPPPVPQFVTAEDSETMERGNDEAA